MQTKAILLSVSATVMLLALALWMFPDTVAHEVTAPVFTIASVVFLISEKTLLTGQPDTVVSRLRLQQTFGGLAYIAAGLLQCNQVWSLTPYLIHNEWIVAFAIGCVFQLYTAFRLPDNQ